MQTRSELDRELDELREVVEEGLSRWLLPEGREDVPEPLRAAMDYAVFPAGKRLRPVLCLMACRAAGGELPLALPAAVGLELIHCYSLVHDDLPAMDDDSMRRGRPTCHVQYGEAMAILAGDALLTRAFEVVGAHSPAAQAGPLCAEIAAASGVAGMVGGQAADLLGEKQNTDPARVEWIHRHKTGELLRISIRAGAMAAGREGADLLPWDEFGSALGLAFQVVDDLLGRAGSERVTGKPVGKDDERGKQTYPAAFGEREARRQVQELTERAVAALSSLPRTESLQALAVQLGERVR